MRTKAPAVALIGLLGTVAPSVGFADERDTSPEERFLEFVIEEIIVEGFERYSTEVTQLADLLPTYCEGAAGVTKGDVDARFHAAMDAWQSVSFVHLGSIGGGAELARFQFWPDPRAVGARQLQGALRTESPALLDPHELAAKSIALGDLQTLERLLFAPYAELSAQPFACRYAASIARYQGEMASRVLDEHWRKDDGLWRAMRDAGKNDAYPDPREPIGEILTAVADTLHLVKVAKVLKPLGPRAEVRPRPRRAESWLSGRSLRNVRINVTSLKRVIGGEAGLRILSDQEGWSARVDGANAALEEALAHTTSIGDSMFEATSVPLRRAQLRSIVKKMTEAQSFVTGPVAETLDITIRFNARDGDGAS